MICIPITYIVCMYVYQLCINGLSRQNQIIMVRAFTELRASQCLLPKAYLYIQPQSPTHWKFWNFCGRVFKLHCNRNNFMLVFFNIFIKRLHFISPHDVTNNRKFMHTYVHTYVHMHVWKKCVTTVDSRRNFIK